MLFRSEAGPGQRGSFRPAPGPTTQRDASPSLMLPGRCKVSLPQPWGPRLSPRVQARPGTGSHHVPPGLGPQVSPDTCHLPREAPCPPPPRAEALVPSGAWDPVGRGQRMKVKVKVALSCPAPRSSWDSTERGQQVLVRWAEGPGKPSTGAGSCGEVGHGGQRRGVGLGDSVGPRGHGGGAGGRAGEETGAAGGHAVQWVDGWAVGGGLSPWRASTETEACLPEPWSPAWGEAGVRSCHGGSGSPGGESTWPDPPTGREGGRHLPGPGGLGGGAPGSRGGKRREGRVSRLAGASGPGSPGPTQGPGAELGPSAGTRDGEHLACLRGPRGLPCCSC